MTLVVLALARKRWGSGGPSGFPEPLPAGEGNLHWVMKAVSATATGTAATSIDTCYMLLSDVEHYPQWYPDGVRRVEVLERDGDGTAMRVDAVLNAIAGPLRRQFEVRLDVERIRPTKIGLVRVADDRGDHEALTIIWLLRQLNAAETEVTVEMVAYLDVPIFLPIDPIAREVANGFLQAAIAAV
ncbi:MAG: SRPBCC family protein [Solirubrobacteraceae bacterium]